MRPLRCFSLLLGARSTPGAGRHFLKKDDERLREVTFRHFPNGFTVLNADGGWYDHSRGFIAEESRQIIVCAPTLAAVRRWCGELAHVLQQKELLVVEVGPAATFRAPAGRSELKRV